MATGKTTKDYSFQQHQYAFTAHIRDPQHQPGPAGVEDRRMNIYRELLFNNIDGFIADSFPVIREIYNNEDWHRMIRDFYARHQSHTPFFLEIPREFIDYLQNERAPQPEDPAALIELAHYEWVEIALHMSDETIDMTGIDANGNLLHNPPVFSPLAWPLVYQFPVHQLGPDYLPETPPAQPTCLVAYRNRDDEVNFLHLNPLTARLIDLCAEDNKRTGQQAIDIIIDEINHPDPDIVNQGGKAALEQLHQLGIIAGTHKPS